MAMPAEKFILFIDDTGSRDPDKSPHQRSDQMDCFGLGGILVKGEDVIPIIESHAEFCAQNNIDYPLHSSEIRGGHGRFGWLRKPENAGYFLPDLSQWLLSQPSYAVACIIDRPGYVRRYETQHEKLWMMCKTAFCILVERATKFSVLNGRKLEIIFEQAGKNEDRDFLTYCKALKEVGSPFNAETSLLYSPLLAAQFRSTLLGRPIRKTKAMPLLQIADLVLYPLAKGKYDPNYRPYKDLLKHKKLIDQHLTQDQIPELGIKYSCFGDR